MPMSDILGRYAKGPRLLPPAEIEHDFEEVLHEAGPGALEEAFAEAFRSEETPPFEEMVAKLFEGSDASTRAGLLDNLLAGLQPSALGTMRGTVFADVLRRYAAGARVAPARAAEVDPEHVREAALQARRQNPGVLERVSRFYARHPEAMRHLGNDVMAIVLSRLAQSTRH